MHNYDETATFHNGDEILSRLVAQSQWIANYLRALRSHAQDERHSLLLDNLIKLQTQLSDDLRAYQKTAPQDVLHTFSQYSADEGDQPSLGAPRDIDTIVDKALNLNEEIYHEAAYLAEKDNPPAVREAFQNLEALVDSKRREISMSAQTIRDM